MKISTALVATFSMFGGFGLCCGCGANDAQPPASSGAGGSGTGGTQPTSGGAGAGGAVECPTMQCSDRNDGCMSCAQPVTGIPFVKAAIAGTDNTGSTATVRLETDGICLSGNSTKTAGLALAFVDLGPEPPLPTCGEGMSYGRAFMQGAVFDAAARGITQVAFTIDSPPSMGVASGFMEDAQDPAIDTAECVLLSNFTLRTAPGEWTERFVTETTAITAKLDEFLLSSWEPVAYADFDPSRIAILGFSVHGSGSFDFCIRNLRFLDANGAEVTP